MTLISANMVFVRLITMVSKCYNYGIHVPRNSCDKRGNGKEGKGTLMAKKGKHSKAEIAVKLVQAGDLAMQGKLQSEIARTLGVSLMTLHRWRKMSLAPHAATAGLNEPSRAQAPHPDRIAELQLENSRLRRLVTDLLLEKIKLEEASQVDESSRSRASR
jgi:putative transposase